MTCALQRADEMLEFGFFSVVAWALARKGGPSLDGSEVAPDEGGIEAVHSDG